MTNNNTRPTSNDAINVLLIGGGGREHAIAWKISQSTRLDTLFIAPGNPGTALCGTNVDLDILDYKAVLSFCEQKRVKLVVVGPEGPLAQGIVDYLAEAGVHCFGPSQKAAQIESSKAFSKNFMARHGIPTAGYAIFDKVEAAQQYVDGIDTPVVIKASGLAAGKGVILPETKAEAQKALSDIFVEKVFGQAGERVVIEERITGSEVSLMAFADGKTILPMIPAQDHKRLLAGDLGPNTGGMGAYALDSLLTEEMKDEALETILKPAISGLRVEGAPFVGVLYAGLMLTQKGLQVLEFNCRFGDPETQAVLPLLESDLLEIMLACVDGKLAEKKIMWKKGSAVSVVLAGREYPGKPDHGTEITINTLPSRSYCFHAGTKIGAEGRLVSAGGRILSVTATGRTVQAAVDLVYKAVKQVQFDGMQYRKDIASKALGAGKNQPGSAYQSAGVNIDAGNRAVTLMKDAVKDSYTPAVLSGIGSFGGLFDASFTRSMRAPVLVASTDGVGTKVKLAAQAGQYQSIGFDIVNHCINDILVQGARPLFFMDYFATSRLNPEQAAEVVRGIALACKESGLALLGGETAEMPGVYARGEFDVAGTIIGVVEKDNIMPRSEQIAAGDVIIGLASSGPHTNGYSLIRKVFRGTSLGRIFPELGVPLSEALLAPHRSYYNLVAPLLESDSLKALAHITGGGFIENIPRILPEQVNAVINTRAWSIPPLWRLIRKKGDIAFDEMFRVFNMGIGMVMIVDKWAAAEIQAKIPEQTWQIGELKDGSGKVILN